jgi:hypothetical protein
MMDMWGTHAVAARTPLEFVTGIGLHVLASTLSALRKGQAHVASRQAHRCALTPQSRPPLEIQQPTRKAVCTKSKCAYLHSLRGATVKYPAPSLARLGVHSPS